jgi:Tfp pilus assembly protein PilO
MNKPQRNILISIGFFLIFLILSVALIIVPWIKEMKETSEDFLTEKRKITSLKEKIANLDILKAELLEIEKGTSFYNNSFINEEDPIEFITFLERIAEGLEVSLAPLTVSKIEMDGSLFAPLAFQLSASGKYDNFARFLDKLESSEWILNIKDINISRSSTDEGNEVRAELSFKVYRERK